MPIDPGSSGRTAGRDAPTLDQVAREAGVSRATASRVVNGEARVSAATRSAVERAVSRLGSRAGMADTLVGVTGAFVPARAVLNPVFLARMLV